MQKLKPLLCLLFIIGFAFSSSATWSIIVVDPVTKEIGIAGASCTPSVYGIGAIVPGKGAIVVQAMSNYAARLRGVQMIKNGASATEIIKAIKNPYYRPEEQQYAVICLNDWEHPQTYTGSKNNGAKGALTAKGISVQGNTLTSEDELQAVLDAALQAQKDSLPIHEILMRALEAGAKLGGDKRCGELKATSAFLTVMKPGDDAEKPFLNIVVPGHKEKRKAVDALRAEYDMWRKK